MDDRAGGILITGGTGFLGRALARALLDEYHGPIGAPPVPRWRRVCIYSRNEHAQAAMFQDLGADPRLRMFIGDVRDEQRLQWAMRSVDYVIHAAALKRIEVGHYNPGEMVKTNVLGAMNVVEAAIAADVARVVFVSTDKAYQPVSPYGLSKAMAEALFLASNNVTVSGRPRFVVCRYGNVAGSTGSVIPLWRKAFAEDRLITITDPLATRFWMRKDQAVELVLGALTSEESVLIPTLPAFQVLDLFMALAHDCGKADAAVTVSKLANIPDWEKQHESMGEGNSSEHARRMTIDELREELKHV